MIGLVMAKGPFVSQAVEDIRSILGPPRHVSG